MYTWNIVFHMKSGKSFPVKFETELDKSSDVLQYFTDILNKGGIRTVVFKQSEKSVISVTLNEVEAYEISVP